MSNFTVRQIAEVASVSKQAIQNRITKLNIQPVETIGTTKYYSRDDAVRIVGVNVKDSDLLTVTAKFAKFDNERQATDNDYIAELKERIRQQEIDIKAKDDTISELTQQFAKLSTELVTVTKNQQELLARHQQLIAEINNSKSPSSAESGEVVDGDPVRVPAQEPKRSFFWRLFHR